jgi:hypothetical protein
MNAALGARPSAGGDRLDNLRLKEAYALLREAKVEAAICLVNTLRITPHLEKEVLRFFDEAGLSSGKVPILEQKLSAKLEEISRDSPSLAEALSILHQLHRAELQSHKPEAADQCLISLKTEVLNETVAELGQHTSNALSAQDIRIQRLEERTQRKEADDQETLASLRVSVEALTENQLKAGEEISQVKSAQDAWIQRSVAAKEECLISLRELRALHEQAAKSEEEDKRVQSFMEQSLSSLTEEVVVLRKDLAQVASQCRSAQSANEATLRSIEGKSQKAEADIQEALNIIRGDFWTLREHLDEELSQCKQRLKEQSLKTEANEISLQDTLYHLHEVALPTFFYSYEY